MEEEIHLYSYPSKYSKNKLKVLIYYPNKYYVGMSNLGFHTVYHILKQIPEVYCERGFYPELYSYDTKTNIKDFEIIIFSVSFEIDFMNIIELLINAGIELDVEKREKPFIIAGGIAITLNPFLFRNIFNLQLIGEGEELVKEFIYEYINGKNFEKIEGIYTKNTKEPIRRLYNKEFVAHSVILTPKTEFSNTLLIEIARGCPFACKFCAVSYNYRPFRIRNKDYIFSIIELHKKRFKKVGLISSNVCSHPDFLEIGEYLLNMNKKFSISSLRIDTLNDEIVQLLKRAGNNTFTIGIETGSEILRKKINKKLTNEQIFSAIDILIKNKILNLKFYFLIGLPEETFDDIVEIVNTIKKIQRTYLSKRKDLKHLGKFIISINPFIPKRNTPFFNFKIEVKNILEKKYNYLKRELKKIPNVIVTFENLYLAYLQYFLSTQNEKILPELIKKVKYNISNKKFIDKINKIYY